MSSLGFREATEADLSFVIDSWLVSYREAHAAGLIAMDDWRVVMTRQITRILKRPGLRVIVANKPGEEAGADIYGWIAVEAGRIPLVFYLYVKKSYRRLGIARRLLRAADLEAEERFDYACKTRVVTKLLDKIPSARWNPMRARYPSREQSPDGAEISASKPEATSQANPTKA